VIDYSYWKPASKRFTYRSLIEEKLADRPAWQLTLDLLLGSAADKAMTPRESMYMPSYMMDILDKATIRHGDRDEPLVIGRLKALDPASPADYSSRAANPSYILWPLVFIALLAGIFELRSYERKRPLRKSVIVLKVFDSVFFVAVGIIGCVAFFLSFISTHAATQGNFNVLFLLPIHLIAPFLIFSRKRRTPLSWYWLATAFLAALPLVFWPIWPQHMNPLMIPLLLLIVIRASSIFVGKRQRAGNAQ